tara:strand:+ start:3786 stop:4484 length:699 start_codon:yes stop_codon:yes gene_type:complete
MLEIKNLEAGYGSLKILKGVNLVAKEGDLVALIGPNGCGKSTTLKCIFGLLRPYSGNILFKGKKITRKRPDRIVRFGISYVPQGRRVFQTMTVEENLEMGAFILSKELARKRLKEIYDYFPILKQKKHQKATFLSGGQQQMLSIGRALMLKPRLLLLDEPSLGLDPKMMVEIFRKIKEINKKRTTVILVEQNASMALEICNRAYVLENGKIALKGGKDLAKKKDVKDLYVGH